MSALARMRVHPPALRRFAVAHPIAAFLHLTFSIAYPLMTLVALNGVAVSLLEGRGTDSVS
jgi:hypothetical protein